MGLWCTKAVALSLTLGAVVTWDSGGDSVRCGDMGLCFLQAFALSSLSGGDSLRCGDMGSKRLLVLTWGCAIGNRFLLR